jgi:hypothetical protein
MSTVFEDLEKQARALDPEQKATLARILIEDLDESVDTNAGQLWLEEARRRYEAFLAGALEAQPGDEVMEKSRDSLGRRDKGR